MKSIFLYTLLIFQLPLSAQEIGSFIDERDGQIYKTVTYEIKKNNGKDHITWMAQNLNYIIQGSNCYDDSNSNCEKYGRLYTWTAAVNACSKGWHLPSDEEWQLLANLYGGISSAGTHLKSTSILWKSKEGTNKSLFNGLPSGSGGGGKYFKLGSAAIYWSSDFMDKDFAWDWKLVSSWSKIQRWKGFKINKNSVRCVKD